MISSSARKSRPDYIPSEVLNPSYPPAYPLGSSPFTSPRNIGPLDKIREIIRRSLNNPDEIWYTDGSSCVLDRKSKRWLLRSCNSATIEAKLLPLRYFQLHQLLYSPNSPSFRTGKGKCKGNACIWLKYAFQCCYILLMKEKRPFDHPQVPDQIQWSNPSGSECRPSAHWGSQSPIWIGHQKRSTEVAMRTTADEAGKRAALQNNTRLRLSLTLAYQETLKWQPLHTALKSYGQRSP